MLCKSFLPIVNKNCQILILGSMPGVKSLTEQEYYAHPKNRFWSLMQILLQNKVENMTYSEKKQLLLRNKIALWDTLANCEREGSLDSDILAEQPNDLVSFLQKHPHIDMVICNGGKAAAAFKKYFAKQIPTSITVYYLPSTSPANARMSLDGLVEAWGMVINKKRSDEKMKKLCGLLLATLIAGICVNFTQSVFAKSKFVNEKTTIGYGAGNEYVQKYLDNKDVRQLILVEQSARRKRLATLYLLEKSKDNKWVETLRSEAFLGKKGLYKTKEGDKRIPVGDYGIIMAFGIKDNPGAKMVYTKLNDKMDICGERENYNQFVDVTKVNHKCGEDGERLIDYVPQFNYVLFIDYNKECVFGKGSAIFLHCRGTHKYTHGCVAITEDNMVKVMQRVDKNVRICIYPHKNKVKKKKNI